MTSDATPRFHRNTDFRVLSESWTLDPEQRSTLRSIIHDSSLNTIINGYWKAVAWRSNTKNPESLSTSKLKDGKLGDLAIAKLHQTLREADDIDEDLRSVLTSLHENVALRLLDTASLPYVAFRAWERLSAKGPLPGSGTVPKPLWTTDEKVLQNDEYLRERSCSDDLHLVYLEDLFVILKDGNIWKGGPNEDFNLKRTRVPLTELPLFDSLRKCSVSIRGSDESFSLAFHRATNGLFRDFDWNNVMVVGDAVMATLVGDFCAAPEHFKKIELRIYGTEPAEATEKLRYIHKVWIESLAAGSVSPNLVRRPDIVTFRSDNGTMPVEVSMRLFASKIDALMESTMDPNAIGYDGNNVIMLPRCARAIETGYTIATTRNLFNKPPPWAIMKQETQIIDCANKGFGMRILPLYSKSLEDDSLEPLALQHLKTKPYRPTYCNTLTNFRKPNGKEPGFKTLRRVAYVGQDRANRTWRVTPLSSKLGASQQSPGSINVDIAKFRSFNIGDSFDLKGLKRRHYEEGVCASPSRKERGLMEINFRQYPWLMRLESPERPERFTSPTTSLESLAFTSEIWRLLITSTSEQRKRLSRKEISVFPRFGHLVTEDKQCWNYRDRNAGAFMQLPRLAFTDSDPGNMGAKEFEENEARWTSRVRSGLFGSLSAARNVPRTFSLVKDKVIPHFRRSTNFDDILQDLIWPLAVTPEAEARLSSCLPPGMLADSDHPDRPKTFPLDMPETYSNEGVGNLRCLVFSKSNMWLPPDWKLHSSTSDSTRPTTGDPSTSSMSFPALTSATIDILLLLSYVSTCSALAMGAESNVHDLWRSHLLTGITELHAAMLPQIQRSARWRDTVLPLREAMMFRAWALATVCWKEMDQEISLYNPAGIPDLLYPYHYPVPDELFWGPEFEEEREKKGESGDQERRDSDGEHSNEEDNDEEIEHKSKKGKAKEQEQENEDSKVEGERSAKRRRLNEPTENEAPGTREGQEAREAQKEEENQDDQDDQDYENDDPCKRVPWWYRRQAYQEIIDECNGE